MIAKHAVRFLRYLLGAFLIAMAPLPVCAQPASSEAPSLPSTGPLGRSGTSLAGDVTIQVDEESGSIIIITDEETNEEIKKVIDSLDRPVPQILIKVVFLEVTHGRDLDLGVEGRISRQHGDYEHIIRTVFGLGSETRGAFYQVIEDDLSVTLRAIAEVGKLEVLSKPSVLTRNNKEAVITVGQEVPFVRNSRVTSDGQVINTVEYEDIGIILSVIPFVTEDGRVEMDLYTEISTITGDTVPISDTVEAAVFAKRYTETEVIAPDGKTVVIGGLMEDSLTETVRKVPILGDIPILGFPFRRTEQTKAKTELLIFLTPYVVRGDEELRALSNTEKDRTELMPEVFPAEKMDKYLEGLED